MARRPRSLGLVLFIVVLVGAVWLCLTASALAVLPKTNIAIDGTPLLEHSPPSVAPLGATAAPTAPAASAAGAPTHDGRSPDFTLALPDFAWWGTHDVPFWKEYSGKRCDIYVGWDDLTAPANSSQQDQTITSTQVNAIGSEFDRRIWASDVFHFGVYKDRSPAPGADGQRVAVMIYNIRDDAYYGYSPNYVGGYFLNTVNDAAQLNAVFLDSFDWVHRTGPSGSPPYLVEGTLAHEFAHLIQNDTESQQADFIKEGLAELATQFLYGPRATSDEIGQYLLSYQDSLTGWNNSLADYGDAALWQDFLWEQRGGWLLADPVGKPAPAAWRVKPGWSPLANTSLKFRDQGDRFIWKVAHDPGTGLDVFAHQLPGGMKTVERSFRDWTLANLLDGRVHESRWNYRNLRLGGPDSGGATIAAGVAQQGAAGLSGAPPFDVPLTAAPWSAYYCSFVAPTPRASVSFAGTKSEGVLPPTGTYEWWGGTGDYANHTLTRRIDDVQAGDMLTFQTWFDIEQDFDFGYVEASTDGMTWSQLPQLTSLPASWYNINMSDAADYQPGGLTGNSGGWQTAQYSLEGYTGTVYLRFRYATDVSTELTGWYVDDLSVGTAFVDNVATRSGWVADPADGWQFTTGVTQNDDWTADVFAAHKLGHASWYTEQPVVNVVGRGTTGRTTVDTRYLKDGLVWAVVSNHPDAELPSQGTLTVGGGR